MYEQMKYISEKQKIEQEKQRELEMTKRLEELKDFLANKRRKTKELLEHSGKNFFVKYYEILKNNSLMDALDFVQENSSREINKKRVLYAKKIFGSNLEFFALELILSEDSILESVIILKAKALLLEESKRLKWEDRNALIQIKELTKKLENKNVESNKKQIPSYEQEKKEYFIKNAGNSGNKEQKGEDYKRELRGHLYKVGIVYFLKYYYDLKLKSVEEICNCITEKISLESKKNIANNAKKIFEAQLNIPILREIVSSKDFERVDVKKAEKILLQETYGIY